MHARKEEEKEDLSNKWDRRREAVRGLASGGAQPSRRQADARLVGLVCGHSVYSEDNNRRFSKSANNIILMF